MDTIRKNIRHVKLIDIQCDCILQYLPNPCNSIHRDNPHL